MPRLAAGWHSVDFVVRSMPESVNTLVPESTLEIPICFMGPDTRIGKSSQES